MLQLLASNTLTVYVPAVRPVLFLIVGPSDHENLYGAIPPDTESTIEPSFPPLQATFPTIAVNEIESGSVIMLEH